MNLKVRFLGLDVHAETISVAVAEPDGEVRSLGTIANRADAIRKMVKKLGDFEQLKACYGNVDFCYKHSTRSTPKTAPASRRTAQCCP